MTSNVVLSIKVAGILLSQVVSCVVISYTLVTFSSDQWCSCNLSRTSFMAEGAQVPEIFSDTRFQNLQAPMAHARYAFTATQLKNGSILVVGGAQLQNSDLTWQNSGVLSSCELFTKGVWTSTSNLTYPRAGHQVCLFLWHLALKENLLNFAILIIAFYLKHALKHWVSLALPSKLDPNSHSCLVGYLASVERGCIWWNSLNESP